MSSLALGLVLLAALLHAGWNLALKTVDEKSVVTAWSILAGTALLLPLTASEGLPQRAAWPYLLVSAGVQAVYMGAVAAAYSLADFSLVYPIARGAAPAFLALWSTLFLDERINVRGGLGLALIVAGIAVVGGSRLLRSGERQTDEAEAPAGESGRSDAGAPRSAAAGAGRRFRPPGAMVALLVALLISIYTTLDGAAVQLTASTPYTVLLLGLSGVIYAPFALWRSGGRRFIEVGRRRWRRIVGIGLAGSLAYILALNAYAIAQVSYAGAVREVSVIFGAFAGWKLLGEDLGPARVIGAGAVCGRAADRRSVRDNWPFASVMPVSIPRCRRRTARRG